MQLLFAQPLITTSSAHLVSLGLCAAYVGSLYLSKNARIKFSHGHAKGSLNGPNGYDERGRDHPDVIRARLVAVSIATVLCCLGVFGVIFYHIGADWKNLGIATKATALRLGLHLSFSSSTIDVLPHLVVPFLFFGPLFASYLGGQLPGQRYWTWQRNVAERFFGIMGLRTYWVGPITEEIVFRACVLSVYHLSGASRYRMIFLGPLTFGLAHVHHAWETFNRYGRNVAAAKRAIFSSIFQFAYTTLFGFLASFLFLRTGSIFPPITAHIFCNTIGVPELTWELRRYPKQKKAIIIAYLIGIAGFVYTLLPWTKTNDNFYWAQDGDPRHSSAKY
ncbi:hypothetical protein D9613_012095 [Agrocybe pediades]|uniref:intramembrane prenyl-peptidase Rce1 n=1 Tax=Agrocybe pediades TaxID=84607 RepID=A0A8H4VTD4_9AGAR|nr:hypothetical protein D9613_012095 [Agrocybe pediades]